MNFLKILLILLILIILFKFQKNSFSLNSSSGKEIYFIHIPKNAGSTVEEIFKANGIDLGKYKTNQPNLFCSEWHIPPKYNKDINFKKYITFTVIRDPIDRIVSEANYSNVDNINDFIKNNLKFKPNYSYDCHLLPQSEYLTDYYGNKVENILYFKNFNSDFEKFVKKYNLGIVNYKDKVENISTKKFSKNDIDIKNLELIKEYYKSDFKLLK
jgi:hypothetical protein